MRREGLVAKQRSAASDHRLLDDHIDRAEIRERYKSYLANHYLGLHITVVSVVLALAGAAAASLVTRHMGAHHQLLVLWLLWVGSLAATAVAYGGPMVGAFALPAQIPSISDLLLPLLLGIVELMLFSLLISQITSADFATIVSRWTTLMGVFGILAMFSVLRARYHYLLGIKERVYSGDVLRAVGDYITLLNRDMLSAAALAAISWAGVGLQASGAIRWPIFVFPMGITVFLLLGLRGHAGTAGMWRSLLSARQQDRDPSQILLTRQQVVCCIRCLDLGCDLSTGACVTWTRYAAKCDCVTHHN
jgi:hypothetical protein